MNKKLVNKVRDAVEESKSLNEKKAKALFETAFPDLIDDLSMEAREEIFSAAFTEATAFAKGETNWNSVFNSYVALVELIETVRTNISFDEAPPLNELALQVYSSPNRLGMLFHILRKQKDMSEAVGRSLIEAAFPTALNGLNDEARLAIFTYAYERGSSLGWGEVVEEYTKVIDVVGFTKTVYNGEN